MKFSNWNNHRRIAGKHSELSPSQHAWVNYDEDKLILVHTNRMRVEEGTKKHEYAAMAIKLGIKQRRANDALTMFINDAIRYDMDSEVMLSYDDEYAFGTTDAILLDLDKNQLKVFDLKTGATKASFVQLDIYVAYCLLEYGLSPYDFDIEERIYQYDGYEARVPNPTDIKDLMNLIVRFVELLRNYDYGIVS